MISIKTRYALVGTELDLMENIEVIFNRSNKVVDIIELDSDVKNHNLFIPAFFNAHVHSADIGLRGIKTKSLDDLVGPDGIKHQHLVTLDKNKLQIAIIKSYKEALLNGILGWADFREGGLEGLSPYPIDGSQSHIPFARPLPSQIDKLPNFAHLGIRSIRSFEPESMIRMTKQAHSLNKKIFMHISESENIRQWSFEHLGKSDISWALDEMYIDSFVHLTNASKDELAVVKEKGINAILCLSSNLFTKSGVPPIQDIFDLGINWAIGTDNAMFSELSLLNEMRFYSKYTIPELDLLKAATINGATMAGLNWGLKNESTGLLELKIPSSINKRNIVKWIIKAAKPANILRRIF